MHKTHAVPIVLPELGDRSSVYLSAEKEEALRKEFMALVYDRMKVIETPEIDSYINDLGYKLVAQSDKNTQSFYFFVVLDDSINAFAGPGGVIGIHSGLIQATQNESELAAVLAHEIAHVTQRHLARAYEAVSKASLPTTAAILAAIILGSQNTDLGQAALTSVIAGGVQNQINFTRDHEKEADAVGIRLLANAGFDVQGMSAFFERLKKKSELSEANTPVMLRTHPLTMSRIAEARARTRQLKGQYALNKGGSSFSMFRAQVMAEHAGGQKLGSQIEVAGVIDRELLSLLRHLKNGDSHVSVRKAKHLLAVEPLNVFYQAAYLKSEWAEKNYKEANRKSEEYIQNNPDNPILKYYHARSNLLLGSPEKALFILKEAMRNAPKLYYLPLLARAQEGVGKRTAPHETLADYFLQKGFVTKAIEQLNVAVKKSTRPDKKKQIEERLTKLTTKVYLREAHP